MHKLYDAARGGAVGDMEALLSERSLDINAQDECTRNTSVHHKNTCLHYGMHGSRELGRGSDAVQRPFSATKRS